MSRPFRRLRQFLRELKRRNVYKVGVTYAIVAFVVWQAASLLFPALRFPAWTTDFVIVLTLLGFPVALVIAWAFEVTPEGVRRTPDAEPAEEGDSGTGEELSTGYKVLVGIGLVGAAIAGGWYLTGGGGETPEISEGTVAVLPFQVSGPGTESWREGMVTMLGTGLDGAAGLRAIDDQTVLAAWERAGEAPTPTDTPRFLDAARRVGAQYAIVGSAAKLGGELQLSADVHQTPSGDRLGQVQVRGSPEHITALTDSLTRRTLEVLLEKTGQEIPSVNLARLTTSSLPALKSYLAGERHFRAGEYEAAIQEYQAAVETDSTFALAYARLARAHGWVPGASGELSHQNLKRAYELSDRLPRRERRLVRGRYLYSEERPLAAADSLRRLAEAYPDDPAVWYNLGETVFHGAIPPGWPGSESAFERAVRLDPGMAPYHRHLVDLAFSVHHDSALAAERIEAFPDSSGRQDFWRVWDLVFGGRDRREAVFTWVDTASSADAVENALPWLQLYHPADADLQERFVRRLRKRSDVPEDAYSGLLFASEARQGHLRDAFRMMESLPGPVPSCFLANSLVLGMPVPDSLVERHLEPGSLPADLSLNQLVCVGVSLVERGRTSELDGILRRLRAAADTGRKGHPSASDVQRRVAGLKGYRAWKAGDLRRAAELWSDAKPPGLPPIWRGDLFRELGELERAEGWYLAGWSEPLAHERLGQLYEEMGKPEKAAAAYRRFIAAWEDADEELQQRVEAARQRLQGLTAAEVEPDE